MVDFELALINGCKKVFGVELRGCSFHLGQSVFMQLQLHGLVTLYMNDLTFKRRIMMLLNLSFLPKHRKVATFYEIRSLISEHADVESFYVTLKKHILKTGREIRYMVLSFGIVVNE